MSEKSYVSLKQLLCPACGHPYDSGEIILDRRLRNSLEHKTVMGFGGPCPNCQKHIDDGRVILVAIDPKQTMAEALDWDNPTPAEVYRTGDIAYLKDEAFMNVFGMKEIPKGKIVWVDNEVIQKLKEMSQEAEQRP